MAKRQSFILETKPLRTNKSMVEQPKLPSKIFHKHVHFFNFAFRAFLIRSPISVTKITITTQFVNGRF